MMKEISVKSLNLEMKIVYKVTVKMFINKIIKNNILKVSFQKEKLEEQFIQHKKLLNITELMQKKVNIM